jgi:hypothetical protein
MSAAVVGEDCRLLCERRRDEIPERPVHSKGMDQDDWRGARGTTAYLVNEPGTVADVHA